jgi:hypothetical protein
MCAIIPPVRVPNAMLDGLDDDVDDAPINVGTPATTTDAAIAPEQPEYGMPTPLMQMRCSTTQA